MVDAKIRLALEGAQVVASGLRDVGERIGSVSKSVQALTAIGGALSIGAFSAWVKGSIEAADATGKLSQKTGIATKDLAGIELAYQQAGLGSEVLTMSMSRLSKGIVEGNKTLDALGIKSKGVDGAFRGTKAVLYDVADAFQAMPDGAQKTALALELFSKSGAEMIPLLNSGSEGLREMDAMAQKLGLRISDETAKDAEKFNDTLDLVKMGTQGVARGIAAQLLPTLTSLAGSFLESMTSGDRLKKTSDFLGTGLKGLYSIAVGVVEVFSTVGKVFGGTIAAIVAAMAGDFKGAKSIMSDMMSDIGNGWKDTAKAITSAWDSTGNAGVESSAKLMKGSKDLLGDLKAREEAAKKSAQEYASAVKKADEFVRALEREADQIGLTTTQKKMMDAATIALTLRTERERLVVMTAAAAWASKTDALADSLAAAKASNAVFDDQFDREEKQRFKVEDGIKGLREKVESVELETAAMTLNAKQLQALIVLREMEKSGLAATSKEYAEMKSRLDDALSANSVAKSAKEATGELDKLLDPTKAQTFGDALRGAFGGAGEALGRLTSALQAYGIKQAVTDEARRLATIAYANDSTKMAAVSLAITEREKRERIGAYGDMAGAAKGFFKENSTGYKVMESAEKAFRAYQIAEEIKTMLTKSGLLTTFTGLFVASKAVESTATIGSVAVDTAATGASIGNSMARAAASTAAGAAKAFEQLGVWGFAGAAAIIAFMASMGIFGGGGSGGGAAATTFKERQEAQGTGTVLGDSAAKSDSIARSLEIIEQNSVIELGYQTSMLQALRAIESALGGAAKGLFQTSGLTGGSAFGTVNAESKSFFGADTSTTISDTGVRFQGTIGDFRAGAGRGTQYEDVIRTSDGGWFHGDSTSTETKTKALSDAAMRPFTLIFDNMGDLMVAAGEKLGADSSGLSAAINQVVIDFAVSTRELKGQDLVDALSAGVGVAFDTVTNSVFPEMLEFQKVGEGLGETLIRVASDYTAVDSIMRSIGTTFGATGMSSIAARENLVELAGGIDSLASKTSAFAQNYLTEAERLAPVQAYVTEQLAAMGLAGVTTREQFKSVVLGLDKTTAAGAAQYVRMLDLADAFAKVSDEIRDTSATVSEIAAERKDLEDQLNRATMTSVQLLAMQRDGIASSNRALFDQVQAAQAAKAAAEALTSTNANYQQQIDAIVKASLPLEELRALEIAGMDATTIVLYDRLQALRAEKTASETLAAAQRTSAAAAQTAASAFDALVKSGLAAAADTVNAARSAVEAAYQRDLAAVNSGEALRITALTDARSKLSAAYETEADALKATKDRFADMAKSLREFNNGLLTGGLTTLSPEAKYQELKSQFDMTYALAKAGDPESVAKLQGISQEFLTASQQYNASSQGYTTDFEMVRAALDATALTADTQVTIVQQQLAALDQQVAGLLGVKSSVASVETAIGDMRSAQAALDTFNATAQRELLQQQLTASVGIKDGVVALAQAMDALSRALANQTSMAQNPAAAANAGFVKSLYSGIGRTADSEGSAYWAAQLAGGTSQDQVAASFAASARQVNAESYVRSLYASVDGASRAPDSEGLAYWTSQITAGLSPDALRAQFEASVQKVNGSHANGLDFVPFDGYRAELHYGEKVQTAQAVKDEAQSKAETIALLREISAKLDASNMQRGAVGMATLEKLDVVVDGLASNKREVARSAG